MMSSIKRNFIYNSLYQILIIFIPLITTPYVSRVLGADGVGIYSYAYSIANYYVLFIMLGLNNYGNRTIARVRDDSIELRKNFWSIYSMQFFLGICFTVFYFIYSFFISKDSIISLTVSFFVISACFDVNWLFFGLEKFKLTVLRNTTVKILTTIFIFIFVKEKSDVALYCIIMTGGIFVSQLVLWPYVLKYIPFYFPKLSEVIVHIKPNLFLFLTVIAVSLFKIMDKIMLGAMTTIAQVGFYESSEKIISIPTALITSLGAVMLPRMSNMAAKKEKGNKRLLNTSILFAMFLSSSMCFGIMAVSKDFVPLFYGKGYEECVLLFLILLPSCLFLAFANVIRTQYLLPNGKDKAYVISAFLGAGTNIVINLLLIPRYQAAGAAIGTLAAEAVVCIYQCNSVRRELPILKYVWKSCPFVVSGMGMFLVLFNLDITLKNEIFSLSLKVLLGVLVYGMLLFIQLCIYKGMKRKKVKHI